MSNNLKLLAISSLVAIAVSAVQFIVAINFSPDILWQVNAMYHLVGPGPFLGYATNGQPLHEGTPVQMIAAYLGLGIGVLTYSVPAYFVLSKYKNQINNLEDTKNGSSKI